MVLGKIKDLLSHDDVIVKLQDKIKESVEEVKKLTRTVNSQQEEQEKLISQIKELTTENKKSSKLFTTSIKDIETANTKISRVVSEIILIKPKLEKELIGKFEKTLQEHLNNTTKELTIDIKEHKKAQEMLTKTQSEQEKLLKEITKMREISEKLKPTDFELSKHAKEILINDQEKLRLMKRVDDLEKLLARMKTRRN